MKTPPAASMRRDIVSAYIATAAKIGSWVIVSALVFRVLGAGQFAVLALIRGTIGLLNYVTLGLAPALMHSAAQAGEDPAPSDSGSEPDGVLAYRSKRIDEAISFPSLYSSALFIMAIAMVFGILASVQYARAFRSLYSLPGGIYGLQAIVILIGIGTLLRLAGDAPGAVLQIRGLLSLDNLLVATGDCFWVVMSAVSVRAWRDPSGAMGMIALWYAASGLIPLMARLLVAHRETGIIAPRKRFINGRATKLLLGYGSMVVLAQLADYLYAPTDYILIDHLLSPLDIASYAPALQIDGALLVLVSGLSAVLLPRAAVAHGRGDAATVRKYYVRGTLWSLVMLTVASAAAWAASPWIFRIWLGNPMVQTQKILPVLLICTTLGGSSMVGRSILLAVGRVWPFTVAVLIAGVTNVVCSYVFVTRFGWELRGIVLGTVVAVVGRCGIWMPWYVLRTLRSGGMIESVEQMPPLST